MGLQFELVHEGRASAAASAQRSSSSAEPPGVSRPPRASEGSADPRDGAKEQLVSAVAAVHFCAPVRCHPDARLDRPLIMTLIRIRVPPVPSTRSDPQFDGEVSVQLAEAQVLARPLGAAAVLGGGTS
ncbi:hypothetical protein GW7_05034 [Heterocephalus glaber]|uniref:Uncharacterized protein n=1 Tax=Heterocephalus glaber TaxID=10181 RepID=G5AZ17_HETGA|nr:hypothetical protein GW7_05034 [Heterocephalus glaber]